MSDFTPKQAALWFASQNFPVFPIHSVDDDGRCTCRQSDCHNEGKHPFAPLAPHGLHSATTDLEVVRSWFAEHYWLSYGIVTDELLVVDVDSRHDGERHWAELSGQPTRHVPYTWQVATGGGGLHIIFHNSPKIRCGVLERGIEIKAVGGYVVGAGCRHKSGRTYVWEPQCSPADAPLAEPPEWLLNVIRSRTHCGRPTSIDEWRALVRDRVTEGDRHRVFLKIAGHLIANPLLDPVVARDLLLALNRANFEPPLSERDCLGMIENLCVRESHKDKWL
jgi:bifunctional DNA primase/polymerase-like protein